VFVYPSLSLDGGGLMNGWVDRSRTHELACYSIENSAMRLKNCISQKCISQRVHLPSQIGRRGKIKIKIKLKYCYVYVTILINALLSFRFYFH